MRKFHFKALKEETFKCKAPHINMFPEDHDYHLGVLKDDPMRG
jgi:hypothetical protein